MTQGDDIINITGLDTRFGKTQVHHNLDLTVKKGEILAIVGGSGGGKTTLLREMLLLQRPSGGSIKMFGQELVDCPPAIANKLRTRWGVMFQQSALFSSLTLLENIAFPLLQHTHLDKKLINEIAFIKILLAGLPADAANKYPAELSGGMQKRAAVARAIALDPELLFLDEPTAGLDPQSADVLDELILKLKAALGLTVIMITHDLDTLWHITDRVAFLGEGKVLAIGPIAELAQSTQPVINEYFNGPRGRAARCQTWKQE